MVRKTSAAIVVHGRPARMVARSASAMPSVNVALEGEMRLCAEGEVGRAAARTATRYPRRRPANLAPGSRPRQTIVTEGTHVSPFSPHLQVNRQ